MNFINAILIFVFGAAIGSFLNVVILRLPNEQTLAGRSKCPNCGKVLSFWELWPLVSFIWLKGKCAGCGKKISWRYPAVEAVAALFFLFAWWQINPQALTEWVLVLELWVLAAFCIAVFIIDFEHYLILDSVVFPLAGIFILINFFLDLLYRHSSFSISLSGFVGALIGVLPFYLIWKLSKGRLMGFGDVKLMLPLGLVLGWPKVLVALFLAVFLGSIVGIALLMADKKTLKSPLPFGCFLALGALVAQVYGQNIISWYLRILGL